jgi:GH43 family beta-xylosidase
METVLRDPVSEEMVIVMSGAAKIYLGEIVEQGMISVKFSSFYLLRYILCHTFSLLMTFNERTQQKKFNINGETKVH